MSKANPSGSVRNTVNLGACEWEVASAMTVEFDLPSVAVTTRMCVTMGAACNNAEKLGMKMQFVAGDGRRYGYSMRRPKIAFELDARGIETGKQINLIEVMQAAAPREKAKTRLKAIKGGRVVEKVG